MTLKSTMIDLPDHLDYLTYLSLSGVSTKQIAMQSLLVLWLVYFWCESLETVYCLCAWMLLQPIHMPVKILVFIYKCPCPLLAKADGCTLGVSPKTVLFNTYCHSFDVNIEYICVYDNTRPTNKSCLLWYFDPRLIWSPPVQATKLLFLPKDVV
jgi:hypothetical protein